MSHREGKAPVSGDDLAPLLKTAFAFARREFDNRIDLDALGDRTDLVELAATLNMLGEELDATTVAVERLEAANEALTRRNRELDEFTYLASHDLQEPLRKIITFADFLEHDLADGLDAENRENLEFLVDAASRMQALIRALLDLSRSGRKTLTLEPVDMQECLDGALDVLEERIAESEARIDIDELPPAIGDKTLLTQLWLNLVANAIKFRSDHSPTIRITARSGDDGVVFGVRDDGIGMKSEYQEQIFSPFRRLHGRAQYPGTGIGLSICRKVVERHHGRIWVESAPGDGAHFQFVLGDSVEEEDG